MRNQRQEDTLAPLVTVLKNVIEDLQGLQERVAESPEAFDLLTRHDLISVAHRVGNVAANLTELAHAPPPSKEIPSRPADRELYNRILGPEFQQFSSIAYDMAPIIITIVDDMVVGAQGRRVNLSQEEVYVFNRLLLLPNGHTTSFFVERFLRKGESISSAKLRVYEIYKKFRVLFGDNVILQNTTGNKGHRLGNNIMLVDRRRENEVAWGNTEDIAAMAGIDIRKAQQFIEDNRSKIGGYYARSQRLSRPAFGNRGLKMSEHFSPRFVRWAVAQLREQKE